MREGRREGGREMERWRDEESDRGSEEKREWREGREGEEGAI